MENAPFKLKLYMNCVQFLFTHTNTQTRRSVWQTDLTKYNKKMTEYMTRLMQIPTVKKQCQRLTNQCTVMKRNGVH